MFYFPRRQMGADMVWHILVICTKDIRLPLQTEAYVFYHFSPKWSQLV
jgi:hypothetical protein